MTELPDGTVTFLFTDVEGSTELVRRHRERYVELIAVARSQGPNSPVALDRRLIDDDDLESISLRDLGDHRFKGLQNPERRYVAAAHEWPGGRTLTMNVALHSGEVVATGYGYFGVAVNELIPAPEPEDVLELLSRELDRN
jgi:hypothetical protein